jgi:general secretion pathway protein D
MVMLFLAGCAGTRGPEPGGGPTLKGAPAGEQPAVEQPEKPQALAQQREQPAEAGGRAGRSGSDAREEEEPDKGKTLVLNAGGEGKESRPEAGRDSDSTRDQQAESRNTRDRADARASSAAGGGKEASPPSEDGQGEEIVLNFDNADLGEVIRTLADMLGINYILDKGVSGAVTINTSGSLQKTDLMPVFYQILETNGYTAVKKGRLYHIVPIKEASRMPITAKLRGEGPDSAPQGRLVIQLIELDSISAQEMTKVLQPFVSSNGTLVALENINVLMVVDHADNMEKILRMVEAFDRDIFESVQYRFFPLEYADAEALAKTLEQMFQSYGTAIQSKINLIAITRLNALLVISPHKQVFEEIEGFVKEFDVPSQSTESSIFVYPVKNGRAGEITDILEQVFSETGRTRDREDRDKTYRNPLLREAKETEEEGGKKQPEEKSGDSAAQAAPARGSDLSIGSGSLHGEVRITADEVRNSLIIEAAPADYRIIRNLLEEIDILPRQVLIEVTIAEVTLDKSTELGVEWSYLKGEQNLSTSLLNATLGSSGLQYTIGKAERWTAAMSALASKNKVNILSSPSIVASNSEEAKIDISSEIPVASSQYEYTSGDNPVVSTNIEYRDTGVLLTVTPHINKNGIVTMEISQEVSEQASSVQVGNLNYPSFFKRSADTILTVKSGQTIVIGGLIRENRSDGSSGAPWMVNIPILKHFFGRTRESFEKTELIILISPRVISSLDDVDAVTDEFKSKLGALYENADERD